MTKDQIKDMNNPMKQSVIKMDPSTGLSYLEVTDANGTSQTPLPGDTIKLYEETHGPHVTVDVSITYHNSTDDIFGSVSRVAHDLSKPLADALKAIAKEHKVRVYARMDGQSLQIPLGGVTWRTQSD